MGPIGLIQLTAGSNIVLPIGTRYTKSGETRIAYQVIGQGPIDLVFVPGFISNLDVLPSNPGYSHLLKRLTTFSRLILLDKRGTGLSDQVNPCALPDLQARADDIRAVMDATGSGRAVLFGASEGVAMSILFAATWPERVRGLALYGGYASFADIVMDHRKLGAFIEATEAGWGNGGSLAFLAPSRADDRQFAEWWARFERLSASPTAAVALVRMNGTINVRESLAAVKAPTLVIHRAEDVYVGPQSGRDLANNITGARYVEIPGRDHPVWIGDVDRIANLVEEFLTGEPPALDSRSVLAVLLVARLASRAAGRETLHLDERAELWREGAPNVIERFGGHAEWSGANRIVAWFDGSTRAAGCAAALHETAAQLGLALTEGIHVGEIDLSTSPLSNLLADVTDKIAAAARPKEILLSRLVSELMSGSGFHFIEHANISIEGIREPLPVVALATERHLEPATRASRSADTNNLSPREHEVLELIADGRNNSSIAVHLGLSEHTVKRHVANILLKLDLPTRAAAAGLIARQSRR